MAGRDGCHRLGGGENLSVGGVSAEQQNLKTRHKAFRNFRCCALAWGGGCAPRRVVAGPWDKVSFAVELGNSRKSHLSHELLHGNFGDGTQSTHILIVKTAGFEDGSWGGCLVKTMACAVTLFPLCEINGGTC